MGQFGRIPWRGDVNCWARLGLPFFEGKKIRGTRNRRKFWLIPSEFRLFRGTENARNSVPSHFEEDNKNSEFRSEPFRWIKKARNSVPNHFADERTLGTREFVPNHSAENKSARNFVPYHFAEKKPTRISYRTIVCSCQPPPALPEKIYQYSDEKSAKLLTVHRA